MLLRQTLAYLPAQIMGPFAQVVAALVWTHWLQPAPYGLLTFLIASQELVFLVSLSWWTHYTMRYLGGLDAPARQRFARSEAPVFAFGALAQAVGTLLVFALLGEPVTAGLVASGVAYVVSRSLMMHLGERARTQGRIAVYTLGQFAGSVAGFVVALAAVAWVAATPEAVLWGFSAAQVVGLALMWRALGLVAGPLVPSRAVLAAALSYGAPLLVAGGFAWVAQNGIRVVVEHGAGAAALGLLAVGWGLGQRLAATLALLVIAASFPLAVKTMHGGSRDEAYRQIAQAGAMLMGLTIPAAVGLCFVADPLAALFVAAPFRATTIAILPFAAAAGAIRNIRMHIADPVFLLIERPRINLAINIVDAVIMVAGCLIGLRLGGLVGTVAGALVGTCLSTIGGLALATAAAHFHFPWSAGLRIVTASGAMAAVLWVSQRWSLAPPAHLALDVALGASIYAMAIAALFPRLWIEGFSFPSRGRRRSRPAS